MKIFRIVLAAVVIMLGLGQTQAATITFDTVPSVGNPILTTLNTDGYNFSSQHFHTLDLTAGLASNGTAVYIGHEGGGLGRIITMTQIGGGTFSLDAFDGSELWIGNNASFPNAAKIRVTGAVSGGGTLTQDFLLDGLLDGTGGVADFQHFTLSGWTNMTSVTFNGVNAAGAENFAFGVDNITVNAGGTVVTPEPTSMTLLGLGVAGLAGYGWQRRKVTAA